MECIDDYLMTHSESIYKKISIEARESLSNLEYALHHHLQVKEPYTMNTLSTIAAILTLLLSASILAGENIVILLIYAAIIINGGNIINDNSC